MNKEQLELIDAAYKNYKIITHNTNGYFGKYSKPGDNPLIAGVQHLTKDSFIQMIKIESDFSKRWGLKIEERELSLEEREKLAIEKYPVLNNLDIRAFSKEFSDELNIPSKNITVMYNIESYE